MTAELALFETRLVGCRDRWYVTGRTYMHPILRMGIRASFWFRLMVNPLMRKTGRIAKLKSEMAKMADMTYVKDIMTWMLIHFPVSPMALVQKK
jgi:hypothetical protein